MLAVERDERHERRLSDFHGPERAALILAGNDPASNADLAAWRALGGKSLMDILDDES
jgi:hypothetical protein